MCSTTKYLVTQKEIMPNMHFTHLSSHLKISVTLIFFYWNCNAACVNTTVFFFFSRMIAGTSAQCTKMFLLLLIVSRSITGSKKLANKDGICIIEMCVFVLCLLKFWREYCTLKPTCIWELIMSHVHPIFTWAIYFHCLIDNLRQTSCILSF